MAQEPDLPQLFTDDEFEKLRKQREQPDRPENDRWDNAGIRPPPQPTDGLPESTLEQQFPRIAKKLTSIWPTDVCASYMSDLVINNDRDNRHGFPMEIIEDLLMLSEIHEMLMRDGGPGAIKPPGSSGPGRQRR